jgi:hypothetical protein
MRGPRTARDLADGVGVALGGDGEAGLEDVDAERGQLMCHAQLFGRVHGAAGRLFAVAKGGVEEDDLIGFGHTEQASEKLSIAGPNHNPDL